MRDALRGRIFAIIEAWERGEDVSAERDALLLDLARHQREHVPPYERLARARGDEAPALPTDVFRFARVAAHDESLDTRVFRTSGTTQADRGASYMRELSIYERGARAMARYALFPDRDRMRLVFLAPHEREAMDSSLSFMLTRFAEWFGTRVSWALQGETIDIDRFASTLREHEVENEPIALLGTSFAFVHALDGLGDRRFALPAGSRIMQTGGFKGRSRTLDRDEMLSALERQFGVARDLIVAEYGMTELSSQAYESTLRDVVLGHEVGPRRLLAPGWMRVTPVDPETLSPAIETGILRIDDAANLDTVAAIQTADLGRRIGDGFEVLGRAEGAVPRGCSLAIDAALEQR